MQGFLNRSALLPARAGRAGAAFACALAAMLMCAPAAAKDTIRLRFERQEVLPWRTLQGGGFNFDGKQLRTVNGAIGIQLGYSAGEFLRAQKVAVDEGSLARAAEGAPH